MTSCLTELLAFGGGLGLGITSYGLFITKE